MADSSLMPTAVVKVQTHRGEFVEARALLDSCSTVNLITENLPNSLHLPKQKCSVNIGAVNGLTTISNYFVKVKCHSKLGKSEFQLRFLVVPNIAAAVPNDTFPRQLFDIPSHIRLADPQFHLPKSVDLLLASNTTFSVLCVGQIKRQHEESAITLQKTTLGWVVAGGTNNPKTSDHGICNIIKLDRLVECFWAIEDIDHEPLKSRDEIACEKHYVANTRRDSTGRYIVRLPFRENKADLGGSKQQAFRRFLALKQKFAANPAFAKAYTAVMQEYIDMGHMTRCDDTVPSQGEYYLPHHAVIKESSDTTKLRVVFDASAKTSSGLSLNDVLMVGPTIQKNIFEQTLRLRMEEFLLTGDIAKMYRQIWIHPDDRNFHKIFWFDEFGEIVPFHLNTVTFGTAPAPFLAIRTLHQLAMDEAQDSPRASKLLKEEFYDDDFISGASSLAELIEIRDEVTALLDRGGFPIRKWASNHPEFLNQIDRNNIQLDHLVEDNPIHKTLGITWDSKEDLLKYTTTTLSLHNSTTKRKLLSDVAKIYDPLGLLGPVKLYGKALIHDCWRAKVTWDESLPQEIQTKWQTLVHKLPHLRTISFPRQLIIPRAFRVQLHGFCDASKNGYGACLFVRSTDSEGTTWVRLACSKSRVAPVNGITIPRLELCAASVLTELYLQSRDQFKCVIDQVIMWSDSTIVLCWLKKSPHLLRPFESNRVTKIQALGDQVSWRHVRSEDNPADPLSRGLLPSDLLNNSLWSSGPSWLSLDESKWPQSHPSIPMQLPGIKQNLCLLSVSDIPFKHSLFFLRKAHQSYSLR